MPFVSTKNNGGVPDPNVNRRGRPLKGDEKTLTRREAKDKEHLTTARKFKPLKHSALKHLKAMLDDPKTSEAAKVKIIDMILKHDMNLLESLYAPSRGDETTENDKVEDVQPQHKPAFSLHMIPPKTEEEYFINTARSANRKGVIPHSLLLFLIRGR